MKTRRQAPTKGPKAEASMAGKSREVAAAAIAPAPARRRRAALFQLFVLIATAGLIVLAVASHARPYFQIDLRITRFVQSYHGAILDGLMRGLSWIGFMPQVDLIIVSIVLALFAGGLRWEAVTAAFAALGSVVGGVIKVLVLRPRPSGDLIHSFGALDTYSFPSGHVVMATAFLGFLAFLGFTLLKPSWQRTLGLVVVAAGILLMGPSRIYMGQHWFSDVMGAYVLGSLWLALAIRLYRWGKPRFFRHQPLAPESGANTKRGHG